VHALGPEGKPTETALERSHAESRIAIHDPCADEGGNEAHPAPRMRGEASEEDVVPDVLVRREVRRGPRVGMVADGEVRLLRGLPDRLEIRVIQRDVLAEQRDDRDRPLRRPPLTDLADRLVDRARGSDDRRRETPGELTAEISGVTMIRADQPDLERYV